MTECSGMKRVRVTLGPRQASLLWQAAARGCDEFEAEDETYRLSEQMADALAVLTRAIHAAGHDPMRVEV